MQTGLSIENHFFRWINLVATQQKRNTEKLIEKTRPVGARGGVSVALRGGGSVAGRNSVLNRCKTYSGSISNASQYAI